MSDKLIKIEVNREFNLVDFSRIVFVLKSDNEIYIKFDYSTDIEFFYSGEDSESIFNTFKHFMKNLYEVIEKENICINKSKIVEVFISDDMYEGTFWRITFENLNSFYRFSIDDIISIAGEDIIKFDKNDFKEMYNYGN